MSSEEGLKIARERIAREADRRTGFLDLGWLGLTELPDELFALAHLHTLNLGIEYLDDQGKWRAADARIDTNRIQQEVFRLAALPGLQSLFLNSVDFSDFHPVASLPNLRALSCSSTDVSDLSPLSGLLNLQSLNVSRTEVRDLRPIARLTNMQSLTLSRTQVTDLGPLAGLANLQSLFCNSTLVGDLTPLARLSNLQLLSCNSTEIYDLLALSGLTNLRSFHCLLTGASDLTPLADLPSLRTLDCSFTQVSDLTPLARLTSLQSLECSNTQVTDLSPLTGLPCLQALDCSRCHLREIPEALLLKTSLERLFLAEARIPGVPPEVLLDGNCLEPLRAHWRDLQAGADEMRDVKLMVLGNGRVGKTQLCRRLRGEPFDESVASTHGIMVTSAPLRPADQADGTRLQIWDFGGQDIYHGTHALFMRSRAIFALVWCPEAEATPEHHHGGLLFRNQPLAYWLDYVRQLGGSASPVAIVQTRCEKSDDEQIPPVSNEKLDGFRPLPKTVRFSALNDRGRRPLDEALAQCVDALREREGGIAVIGAGRAKVKRRIEALRDADAARPPAERQHRTLSHNAFLDFCREAGGISDPRHLLDYLHNAGTVFYRAGLFDNRIIVDQAWALDLIYTVFNREKCRGKIVKQRGRFTRSDLAEWTWNEAGHGVKEQELLLSMMQSCGICFQHRPESRDGKIEAEYIAPDLLPEKAETDVAQKWDAELPAESTVFTYELLPQALMRGVIARIGGAAGLAADYWRGGVYLYEATTGSRGLIEQKTTGPWQGEITVQTQRGQSARLLERLIELFEREQGRIGIASPDRKTPAAAPPVDLEAGSESKKQESAPSLQFAQEPRGDELFISFAWGDNTAEGKRRQDVVERLCAAARTRGITILRDNKVLGLGDSIAKFMNRLAQGQRVFVVLSDKYLKSPYCMYELMETWRRCFQEEQRLLDRVRLIILPDATIFTPLDRLKYAAYWHEKRKEVEAMMKAYDITLLGTRDFNELKMMQKFSSEVGDILAAIADRVLPRTYEQFEAYALDDLIGS
jgi:internalin A